MDENSNIAGDTDIEKALKEFEAKSQVEQKQTTEKSLKNSDVPKMVQWVIKWSGGYIANRKQAEYFLFTFVVIALFFSAVIFFKGNYSTVNMSAELGPPITHNQ